ncbi:MAG: DUF3211 domain-containing protein [Metallosphaera prunae]|uniref:DUF3211 domain-containing protein n=1 Tax=Metallosphaera prunae TaxID=47304 RepID=UPI002272BAE4|nr:DUF3211 domain-containing protein [Metallosphaera prunae]MCY0861550.1 DUF3211 domain-containing protein [Metallosphaera prunae]
MERSITITTTYDKRSLISILSDPTFVLPRLFPPIKSVSRGENSFDGEGRFMTTKFHMHGTVIVRDDIVYGFYLSAGGSQGKGRLIFTFNNNEINLKLEYQGKMEKLSGLFFIDRWFSDFASKLNEEIKAEVIKRRL